MKVQFTGLLGQCRTGFEEMKKNSGDIGKTIASYAIECSINKVMSTEALDFVVDEGVQIHGGYGYMSEYEIETLYRDSRITRIFEGTNEINRMVISSSLLKNYVEQNEKGVEPSGVLQREKEILQLLKNLYHTTISAVKSNGLENFDEEQETAAFISDLILSIYCIESAILRSEKSILANGEDKNFIKVNCTKAYTHETAQKIALRALNLLNHFGDEGAFSQIARRLITSSPENLLLLKRRIAEESIEAEKYVC